MLESFVHEGLHQVCLRPAYFSRIDQGENLARLHLVTDALLDAVNGARHARSETCDAGLVIGDLSAGNDRLQDRLPINKCDIDAGLLDCVERGKLNSSQVVLAE